MLNYAIKVTIATVIVFILLNPEVVGVWNAKKDIAYDTVMEGYYNDN
jgi:hypothetical protein